MKMNSTRQAKLLVKKGTDLNNQWKDGNTAIIWACKNGLTEVVKLLIEKGADPNIQNKYVSTALIYACRKGHIEICKAILSHAIILPELTEKDFKLMLYRLWKEFNVPKDVRALIVSKLELKQLLHFVNVNIYQKYIQEGFFIKINEIAEYTIEALMPMMVGAINLGELSQELKDLLNPEHYEENFGKTLRENIETVIKAGKLYLFVRFPKESFSSEVTEEKEDKLKRQVDNPVLG